MEADLRKLVVGFALSVSVIACDVTPQVSPSSVPAISPSASAAAVPTPSPLPTPMRTGPVVPADVIATNTTPHPIRAIAAGWDICAIRQDGTLGCWGDRTIPPTGTFIALDSADGSACAIREDGRLACWGMIGSDVPKDTYTSISVTQGRACAIRREDAALVCWRSHDDETDGEAAPAPDPDTLPPTGRFTAVSVGDMYDCALRGDGELVCWASSPSPEYIPRIADRRYRAVDLPCAIQLSGALDCFPSLEPGSGLRPPEQGTFTAVSATQTGRGCALRPDGTLRCWGDEGMDQATSADLAMRAPVGTFTAVTVGDYAACAIRPDGYAVCWGEFDELARPAPTMVFEAPVFVTERTIPLRWGALPAFGAITTYDIDRVTGWDQDGNATGVESWLAGTTSKADTVEGSPGQEYCWRARAHDADGRTSNWTGDCTTLPDDDAIFERSSGWSTVRDGRYYLGRAASTTKRGATLTIDVDTPGLALFATTCPSCGTIQITAGGGVQDTISLKSKGRHDRQLVWHGDNGEQGYVSDEERGQAGHIVIEVVSAGRPVTIDALLQGLSLDE